MDDATVVMVPLKDMVLDQRAQPRERLSDHVIKEYAATIKHGNSMPPLDVFSSEEEGIILADGWHRHSALLKAGHLEAAVRVHKGGMRDAILFAVGANAKHGFQRTEGDRRKAAMSLLRDKEWGVWSDREIARLTHTYHSFVGKLRDELAAEGIEKPAIRKIKRAGKEKMQSVANINRSRSKVATKRREKAIRRVAKNEAAEAALPAQAAAVELQPSFGALLCEFVRMERPPIAQVVAEIMETGNIPHPSMFYNLAALIDRISTAIGEDKIGAVG